MATDMSEASFEADIVASLTGCGGYVEGLASDYSREYGVDLDKLFSFLGATQPKVLTTLSIEQEGTSRDAFLHRLRSELATRGVVDVLLGGMDHQSEHVRLYYGVASKDNAEATRLFEANLLSVTRQVRYSLNDTLLSVDLVIFLNGLPLLTAEIKNNATNQNIQHAITQYRETRSPKEALFMPGRCAVHLALDDQRASFCTELRGQQSWFLPFNRGHDDGAGNPPNPEGYRTAYVWQEVLAKPSLLDIVESYARRIKERDPRTNKTTIKYLWPRYHQLQAVRALLRDAQAKGPGQRYLIQHSAGSGKSYSITWLTHQLINLRHPDGDPMFHTVFVITDRVVLDEQLRQEITRFTQARSTVGAVTEGSAQLREFIVQGKRVITSTIQKFPYIVDALGDDHRDQRFALIIDEAHSSQGGKAAAAANMTISSAPQKALTAARPDGSALSDEEDAEQQLLDIITRRKMPANASYFAFTATPKSKTEELFGTRQEDGTYRPFHSYTMKQAIQEGFIMDVLANYTTIESYYKLIKTVEEDPEFDTKRAKQRLRRFVESHEDAIEAKAEVMLEHFIQEVFIPKLIDDQARAMVVTDGVMRAIAYKRAFDALIDAKQLPFKALVAFSGDREVDGKTVNESSLNGFPAHEIPARFKQAPYRILIVAEKFQTGFDEPLLQTMYVDKPLSDVRAVQTLSRLNRAHPRKDKVYVVDFANTSEEIAASFERYYRTTILEGSTDINKLHDLKRRLDELHVYSAQQVKTVVTMFLQDDKRESFQGILDGCCEVFASLYRDDQINFKRDARGFLRLYNFLSALLTFENRQWERLCLFLELLMPLLPNLAEEPNAEPSLLDKIDLESYRNEVKERNKAISLSDDEGNLSPTPTPAPKPPQQAQLEFLSQILEQFNELFGKMGGLHDPDFTLEVLSKEAPARIAQDVNLQNAIRQNDPQKVQVELARATAEVISELSFGYMSRTEDMGKVLRGFNDDPQIRRFIIDMCTKLMREHTITPPKLDAASWEEIVSLLDPRWHGLAHALKERGVPAPSEVDQELPSLPGHEALMFWALPDGEALGLVLEAISSPSQRIELITLTDPPQPDALATMLLARLQP